MCPLILLTQSPIAASTLDAYFCNTFAEGYSYEPLRFWFQNVACIRHGISVTIPAFRCPSQRMSKVAVMARAWCSCNITCSCNKCWQVLSSRLFTYYFVKLGNNMQVTFHKLVHLLMTRQYILNNIRRLHKLFALLMVDVQGAVLNAYSKATFCQVPIVECSFKVNLWHRCTNQD